MKAFFTEKKNREEKGGKHLKKENNIFFPGGEEKQRKKRRKRPLQKLSSLGFDLGLGLETFANFCRVSVLASYYLVSEKKSQIWFRKIWCRKKSISFGFGEFGLRKKYRFRF